MSGLYPTEMDPTVAREAVTRLGAILLLDVPAGIQFGMDSQVFVVGERFCGVKMIPPGMHFVSTTHLSQETASAAVSFFHDFEPTEILVRQWNRRMEQLEEIRDSDQEERWKQGVRSFDFDAGMAPYDVSHWHDWKRLSKWIDAAAVHRLLNGAEVLSIAEEARGTEGLSEHIPSEAALIRQLQTDRGGSDSAPWRLNIAPFPRLIKRSGCTAAELTALNLDKTGELRQVLADWYSDDWKQLLAELQFCFVAFFFGQSLSALEQWKQMLHLVLGCFEAAVSMPTLFKELLRCLRHELLFLLRQEEGASDEVTELLSTSFLRTDLVEFVRSAQLDAEVHASVKRECEKLTSLIGQRLRLDMGVSDEDEYAPVIMS